MHRTALPHKELSCLNVKSTEVKKSCFQQRSGGGKPGRGLSTSEGVLQEWEEETDSSDEIFSTIPSGSQCRKIQDRGITDRMTDRTDQRKCLKQKTGQDVRLNVSLSFALFTTELIPLLVSVCPITDVASPWRFSAFQTKQLASEATAIRILPAKTQKGKHCSSERKFKSPSKYVPIFNSGSNIQRNIKFSFPLLGSLVLRYLYSMRIRPLVL